MLGPVIVLIGVADRLGPMIVLIGAADRLGPVIVLIGVADRLGPVIVLIGAADRLGPMIGLYMLVLFMTSDRGPNDCDSSRAHSDRGPSGNRRDEPRRSMS